MLLNRSPNPAACVVIVVAVNPASNELLAMVNANKYDFFLALFLVDNRFSIDVGLSGGIFFTVLMDMKGYLFITTVSMNLFAMGYY